MSTSATEAAVNGLKIKRAEEAAFSSPTQSPASNSKKAGSPEDQNLLDSDSFDLDSN
jgi:hypothetical protein